MTIRFAHSADMRGLYTSMMLVRGNAGKQSQEPLCLVLAAGIENQGAAPENAEGSSRLLQPKAGLHILSELRAPGSLNLCKSSRMEQT